MMVHYLWLILPFKEYLESLRTDKFEVPSPLIWSECKVSGRAKRKWNGDRAAHALETESTEILKSKLQISVYRHVAIAMARKHIRRNLFDKDLAEKDDLWDTQAGHDTSIAGTIYARQLHDLPGVVESQREGFRWRSQKWHLYLGFQTWNTSASVRTPFPNDGVGDDDSDEEDDF